MDLQQRQTQHGDRRHHTRYETETIQNGRVVLASNSPTNGGITESYEVFCEGNTFSRSDAGDTCDVFCSGSA
jgi:hypothetical protein